MEEKKKTTEEEAIFESDEGVLLRDEREGLCVASHSKSISALKLLKLTSEGFNFLKEQRGKTKFMPSMIG